MILWLAASRVNSAESQVDPVESSIYSCRGGVIKWHWPTGSGTKPTLSLTAKLEDSSSYGSFSEYSIGVTPDAPVIVTAEKLSQELGGVPGVMVVATSTGALAVEEAIGLVTST